MTSMQALPKYQISQTFISKFDLDKSIAELKTAIPTITINQIATSSLQQDSQTIERLLADFELMISPNQNPKITKAIEKIENAVKKFKTIFPSEPTELTKPPFGVPTFAINSSNKKPSKIPGRIAHNSMPDSCYVAVMLNTLMDQSLRPFFTTKNNRIALNVLEENFKSKVEEFKNASEIGVSVSIELLQKLSHGKQELKETEQSIADLLKQYLQHLNIEIKNLDHFLGELGKTSSMPTPNIIKMKKCTSALDNQNFGEQELLAFDSLIQSFENELSKNQSDNKDLLECLQNFKAKATDLKKQTAQKLVAVLNTKIAQDLISVIEPCLDKIETGSVVKANEIAKIQTVLKHYNFIGRDSSNHEDPMGILESILAKVTPKDFALIKGKETRHYDLTQAVQPESSTILPQELGPIGKTVVDPNGQVCIDFKNNFIPLSSTTSPLDLATALRSYLNDNLGGELATVHVLENSITNMYKKYSGVTVHKTERILTQAPTSLILQLQQQQSPVSFPLKLEIATEDGSRCYYTLNQVNCHEFAHEYAYLKYQNEWFLSDDLKPSIENASLEKDSQDINKMCSYGRTFIYKKVSKIVYEQMANEVYDVSQLPFSHGIPKPVPSPENNSIQKNESASEIITEQLDGLITICDQIADPHKKTLQGLFELSWGIASLPKEKKFSKNWLKFIKERDWLIIEDISRQLTTKFPDYPKLSYSQNKESCKEFSPLTTEIEQLKTAFKSLKDLSLNPSSSLPEKPLALSEINQLFSSEFDKFVLEKIKRNIQIIKESLGTEDPVQWFSKNQVHTKAFFRTIEVIGEASKIMSSQPKKGIPTLSISSLGSKENKPLWGKLRNQLHHNKARSWDIVNYAPEKWSKLLTELFPKLESEIISYQKAPESSVNKKEEYHLTILEELCSLCGQDQFKDIRRVWYTIQNEFETKPTQLIPFLFGFSHVTEDRFLDIWSQYAKPHLKAEIDADKNQATIIEMLRIGCGNLMQDTDIKNLTPKTGTSDKTTLVAEMKLLLKSVADTNSSEFNKSQARIFDTLADQFVFLKIEKNSTKDSKTSKNEAQVETIQRDTEKNEKLKKLMSQRLSQITPVEFSMGTFKNKDDKLTESGQLIEAYIQLKYLSISDLIQRMKHLLKEIQESWPKSVSNLENLKSLCGKNRGKSDPKSDFMACLKELQSSVHFITLPAEINPKTVESHFKEIAKKLRTPYTTIETYLPKNAEIDKSANYDPLIETLNKEKEACECAINELNPLLASIKFEQTSIEDLVWRDLKTCIDIFSQIENTLSQNEQMANDKVRKVREIFTHFAFNDTPTFIEKLNAAKITHSFTKKSIGLNSLRNRVLTSLESRLATNLDTKIDSIIIDAEDALSLTYVQQALQFNTFPVFKKMRNSAKQHILLLGDIYRAGLDKKSSDYQEKIIAWENIERKVGNRRLSFENIQEVNSWLPTDEELKGKNLHLKTKKNLNAYLDGGKGFDVGHLPRFEHTHKKIEIFSQFLEEESFQWFPDLRDKKEKLISYFKIAYGIIDTKSKAVKFSSKFKRKIEQLGSVIQELHKQENQHQKADLILLATEYDMQDIGELAQLITERPSLWNLGRHILSPQHLLLISLFRKMMAHYPLMLSPEVIKWNLKYLAFETNNILSNEGNQVFNSIESAKNTKRQPITHQELQSKLFDIKDFLDQLNLSVEPDILYPSLQNPNHNFLHPFGELALLVYPATENQKKELFIHSVIELELILNYQLNGKITILGQWENELINIPSDNQIPRKVLEELIEKKQTVDRWIITQENYEIFLQQPWSKVVYLSDQVVSRADFELYHDLQFFLSMLGFKEDAKGLENFVSMSDLDLHIFNKLKEKLSPNQYATSDLFKWVCCLYECFCPPGTNPLHPIYLPKPCGEQPRLITMLDENGYGLRLLPETTDEIKDNSPLRFYYENNTRLDIFNGRSLLDPLKPVQEEELFVLSEYASKVLKSHIKYIQEKLKAENGLDSAQFSKIKSISLTDPVLLKSDETLNTIDLEIVKFIKQETEVLNIEMLEWINYDFIKYGRKVCSMMLNWMKIDKEIEKIARDYYGKNRLRLRGPYMQLDENSKNLFDNLYIIQSTKWSEFPFTTSFRKFLDRIHLETKSLPPDASSNSTSYFSDNFKVLVTDEIIQMSLMRLLRMRNTTIKSAILLLWSKYPNYNGDQINEKIYNLYTKCDQLFRIVNSLDVFDSLLDYVNNLKTQRETLERLQGTLQEDFVNQFKQPNPEREFSIARTQTLAKKIYDVRAYFNGKKDTFHAEQQHNQIIELANKSSNVRSFLEEWKKQLGEELKPIYYKNLINETREALNILLVSHDLPNDDYRSVPTYCEYWNFVRNNNVVMSSLYDTSGLAQNFKSFVQYEGTFQKLIDDPKKSQALTKDKRLSKLIETYIPFSILANTISKLSYDLKLKYQNLIQIKKEFEHAKTVKREQWVISENERRLSHIQYLIKKRYKEFQKNFEAIAETEFFSCLKLSILRKHLLETNGETLEENELIQQTRQLISEEFALTASELADIFVKIS